MSEQKLVIHEIGTVAERINKLVDYFCKGNKTAFGRAADIQSGVLAGIVGGRGSKPGFEILQKLLTAYPTVEPTWLLFGRGPMLHTEGVELLDTEGVIITPEEAKQLLYLQEVNATSNERMGADMEQTKAELETVKRMLEAFVDSMVPPAKAKQLKAQFPESFPSIEE